MKIGFVSADWARGAYDSKGHPVPGGAGWYRVCMPARELAANKVKTVVGQHMRTADGVIQPLDFDGNYHDDCDVVVFQRWMHADAEGVFLAARAAGQVVVNDVDDWFFGLNPSNLAWVKSHPQYSAEANVNHYRRALAASSLLTVSTPYLAKRLANLGRPTQVLRNAVDTEAFPKPPFLAAKPVIGWTGSTLHRSGDLEILKGVLGPFMERHDIRMFHGGANEAAPAAADLLGVPRGRVDEVGLVSMELYPRFFEQFDLGIVPLADAPFNEAKSALKGMEYAAAGLPFIASATEEYRWFGEGVLCRRPRDWARALERLRDPEERQVVAKSAHERVLAEDIRVRWPDWAMAYGAYGA